MNTYAEIIINHKSPALDRVFTYLVPPHLRPEIQVGQVALVPFRQQRLEGVVVALHDQPPQGMNLREVADLVSPEPLFSRELLALAAWISDYYLCSRSAAMQAMLPAGMTLSGKPPQLYLGNYYTLDPGWAEVRPSPQRLRLAELLQAAGELEAGALAAAGFSRDFLRAQVRAGLLRHQQRRVLAGAEEGVGAASELNQEQQAALAAIRDEQQGANRPFLLRGVTGSGKTEIYLRLIQDQASRGQGSIVLVPEIALSPQMVEMLTRRLELPLAVLHSGLKPTERRHIWQEIAEGRYPVVVGARSAVFAPLPRLGLIIVDEAHETSYKQDQTPRFSALTVAEQRTRLAGASLVLGSATPAVEQYYRAEQGEFALAELSGRYYHAPQPAVAIVDMRDELRQGNKSIFSRVLRQELAQTLADGEQAVLFLNRRGYYQHYACRDCGGSITCPHCAVAMSFHADGGGGRLKCHYCGRSQAPPAVCPECGSQNIRQFGIGTQRVADELARLFPAARILRLDSDSTQERGSGERIYRAMREQRADFLVGTQMVAKGLDFPDLTLAVVVAADTLLNLPDWRAPERCFQLIGQLIGRAGRRSKQGRAVIQTYTPAALPILAAAAGDYAAFYRAELENRSLHGYPPFTHLIRVLLTATERVPLAKLAQVLAAWLRPALPAGDEICGPAEAPLSKLKDRWRWQLLIKCADSAASGAALERAAAQILAHDDLPAAFRLSLDVDPFSVM